MSLLLSTSLPTLSKMKTRNETKLSVNVNSYHSTNHRKFQVPFHLHQVSLFSPDVSQAFTTLAPLILKSVSVAL